MLLGFAFSLAIGREDLPFGSYRPPQGTAQSFGLYAGFRIWPYVQKNHRFSGRLYYFTTYCKYFQEKTYREDTVRKRREPGDRKNNFNKSGYEHSQRSTAHIPA